MRSRKLLLWWAAAPGREPLPGMRRWEFVSLFGSGAAWPMAAIAQQRLPVIGLLSRGRMRILWQRSARFFMTTMAAAVVLGLAPILTESESRG